MNERKSQILTLFSFFQILCVFLLCALPFIDKSDHLSYSIATEFEDGSSLLSFLFKFSNLSSEVLGRFKLLILSVFLINPILYFLRVKRCNSIYLFLIVCFCSSLPSINNIDYSSGILGVVIAGLIEKLGMNSMAVNVSIIFILLYLFVLGELLSRSKKAKKLFHSKFKFKILDVPYFVLDKFQRLYFRIRVFLRRGDDFDDENLGLADGKFACAGESNFLMNGNHNVKNDDLTVQNHVHAERKNKIYSPYVQKNIKAKKADSSEENEDKNNGFKKIFSNESNQKLYEQLYEKKCMSFDNSIIKENFERKTLNRGERNNDFSANNDYDESSVINDYYDRNELLAGIKANCAKIQGTVESDKVADNSNTVNKNVHINRVICESDVNKDEIEKYGDVCVVDNSDSKNVDVSQNQNGENVGYSDPEYLEELDDFDDLDDHDEYDDYDDDEDLDLDDESENVEDIENKKSFEISNKDHNGILNARDLNGEANNDRKVSSISNSLNNNSNNNSANHYNLTNNSNNLASANNSVNNFANQSTPVNNQSISSTDSSIIHSTHSSSNTKAHNVDSNQTKSDKPIFQNFIPKRNDYSTFRLPDINFLSANFGRKVVANHHQAQLIADKLIKVLKDFSVFGKIISYHIGPVITLYEFEPLPGTKSSRVIGLCDDIARSLSANSARISVISGKNALGIELPNEQREIVLLKDIINSDEYRKQEFQLPVALGKNISGEPIVVDLAKMPHLLVAGTTGSGKSVAVNTMIVSILYSMRPDQCKFIMIDPKMLELSVYNGIPHLLTPVVTDPKKAVVALKWVVKEMEERYRMMSYLGVRNIKGYNEKIEEAIKEDIELRKEINIGLNKETGDVITEVILIEKKTFPYIVVIVDEMADLMLVAGKEIEFYIQRLAQMARAAGIHIIMATQRPSVDVITGVIKANLPTRISFAVTSKIDSRTILGEQGAEQLLGMGDMLYMASGNKIVRVHGPFVSDNEVERIVNYLKSFGPPDYLDAITTQINSAVSSDDSDDVDESQDEDVDYQRAIDLVMKEKKVSISYIQRQLRIGYNKSANIVERMEREGIVTAPNHQGKRELIE
jgi:S-DNA-T family DNA segregation ATPase FtsK/SpoIIIE